MLNQDFGTASRSGAKADIHGDDADCSLNIWITPDSANLHPDSGGLVMWDKKAPSDWSYDEYNSGGDKVK